MKNMFYALLSSEHCFFLIHGKKTTIFCLLIFIALSPIFSQDFITKWSFTISATQLNFGARTDGMVNYTWSASPSGNSGSGNFTQSSPGLVTLTGLNIHAGDEVTLSLSPANLRIFYMGALGSDKLQLTDVTQWGAVPWTSMTSAFKGCTILDISATDIPNLSNVSSCLQMFYECSNLSNPPNIHMWDVSNVTYMDYMFYDASSFNGDIRPWLVDNVINMSNMFNGATAFNRDIGGWNVANVTNMYRMFIGASLFNGDIRSWMVSNVTNMGGMFSHALVFNQDISKWDVSNVTDMSAMFNNANAFDQIIDGWDVSKVTDMSYMFWGADLFNSELNSWTVNNVTNMASMFHSASSFNRDLNSWNVANVTDMSSMFYGFSGSSFNGNISNWDVSSVTDMNNMFRDADLFNCDISGWNVSGVTNMSSMFRDASSFSHNLGSWDISPGTFASNMLDHCGISNFTYDSMLIQWEGKMMSNVVMGVDGLVYCYGEPARTSLINNYNCAFIGDSRECRFITTWKTDNPGASGPNTIEIPTFPGETYNYDVDWDNDGIYTLGYHGDATHTYFSPGTYTVVIRGDFPRIYFNNSGDKDKILTIEQWGENSWTSMENAFYGAGNLEYNATDAPDLTSVTNMKMMFQDASSFNGDLSEWNVSTVTDMAGMFKNAAAFNGDITTWTVSNVTDMSEMFNGAIAFNQDIGSWNVGNVTDMSYMFALASVFNKDIGGWNVGNVTNMSHMFHEAWQFNQDLNLWSVNNVMDMSGMFRAAYSFNGAVGNWIVSNVTNMSHMFYEAYSFDQDIRNWSVGNVTDMAGMFGSAFQYKGEMNGWVVNNVNDMSSMFWNASSFNSDISGWNVGNVTNMEDMFNYANSFNQDIGGWSVSGVTNMDEMFYHATVFNHDLGGWDVSSASMVDMLSHSGLSIAVYDAMLIGWHGQMITGRSLGAIDLEYCHSQTERDALINTYGWAITGDTYNCEAFITTWRTTAASTSITIPTYPGETYNYDIDWNNDGTYDDLGVKGNAFHDYGMAADCTIRILGTFPGIYLNLGTEATKIRTIEQWGSNKWTRMDHAFEGARDLVSNATDVPDMEGVTDMSHMFRMARSFNSDIGNWNVGNVTNMSHMFWGAHSFNQDIGGWDVSKVTDMSNMFAGAPFNQDLDQWNVGAVTDMSHMFDGGTLNHLFNGDISSWNVSNVTDMSYMFHRAADFNSDISGWSVDNVQDMSYMFYATSFNQDLSGWNVGNVTDMSYMFSFADSFNGNISGWTPSSVTDMSYMFYNADMFNRNISSWNLPAITNMSYMFGFANSFNKNLGGWNLGLNPNIQGMLSNSGLSLSNYDNTLIGWEAQGISNLTLGAHNLVFCHGDAARNSLVTTYGWTIHGDMYDCSSVPIVLLTFSAKLLNNNEVLLKWETASEVNNMGFEIKRSSDCKCWEVIGYVKGYGTKDINSYYSFIDEHPLPGINYYILRQKDHNGDDAYSDIRSVHCLSENPILIYPNPTNGLVTITGDDINEIRIISQTGNRIKAITYNNSNIDLSDLPAGLYIIEIHTTYRMFRKRIIKN